MVVLNFVIPMERENLRSADSLDQYVVRNIFNIRDLKPKLKEVEFEVGHNGSFYLSRDWFDVFYSVISRFHEDLPSGIKSTAHQCLLISGEHLITRLDGLLSMEQQDPQTKSELLTDMKMIVYLITQLSELLERESIERQSLLTGKKKKDSEESISWEESRLKTLHFMYKILQLSLHRVFDPPVAEEDFINCFANAAFRTLENPIMAHVRYKNVRLSVYQILGSLNARFDYSLSCSFNLVQELKLFEHMVSPLAEAVEVFFREYGCRSIVMEVIQEISRLDPKELSRDASATKSYSSFLLEITERLPESVKPSLSLLILHLDGESYMMRKSILNILGEIVMRVLSKEDLDDSSKENRNQFLEYLEDHIHDSNAHVRSSVIAMWSKLCVAKAIPLSRQNSVLKLTLGRLQDKSSNVRKQAVTLLTSLLQCNPYTFSLPIEELESQLSEENKKYEELEAAASKGQDIKKWDDEAIGDPLRDILDDEDFDEDECLPKDEEDNKIWEGATALEVSERIKHLCTRRKFKKALALYLNAQEGFPGDFPAEKEDIYGGIKSLFEVSPLPGPEDESLGKQRILVAYLKDSVSFGRLMNDSLPCMCQLLASKQVSDILEAIDFFVTAFEFGLLNAMMGVRRMLSLIWSQEAVVKDAVVKAYKRLYIDVGSSSGGSLQVVKNLIALVRGATLGECASLEALVGLLVDSRDIQKDCYTILWQIFTRVMPDTSEETACDALLLIGMIALKEPSVVSSNIPILVEHAFGPRGHKNFRLVTLACKALMKIVPPFKSDSLETPHRFDEDDPLFESLHKIIVQGMPSKERFDYIPMAKAAITVIYDLSEHPDRRMGMIAKELMIGQANNNNDDINEVKRIIFIAGQIAVAQLKHLDISLFCEMKRRNHLREMKQEKKRSGKSKTHSASETPRAGTNDEDDLLGAEGDDAEAEFIRNICENETVSGGNLLEQFVPLLVEVCSGESDDSLKTVAALSLAKFMLVSNEFTESHLRLFFTLLEKSKNEKTRANLIIAAGDLSVRFPNTLEPWTPRMYARLRDESSLVRSNALTVLTHLILNDMIKVKGQISDMALCIIDPKDRISTLAKLFFTELARKGNSLYNVLPDIVSRLSSPEVGVPEDDFREIMKFIICLIEKDKHLESLVEKMCHRFRVTNTERQWRDLSYCLASFNFNDKAIRKLGDNFNCYGDKLYLKEVYDSLLGILGTAKKSVKNETKGLIEELEGKMETAHERGLEDHTANERALKAKMGAEEDESKENVAPEEKIEGSPSSERTKDREGLSLISSHNTSTDEDSSKHRSKRRKGPMDSPRPAVSSTKRRKGSNRITSSVDGSSNNDSRNKEDDDDLEVSFNVSRRSVVSEADKKSDGKKVGDRRRIKSLSHHSPPPPTKGRSSPIIRPRRQSLRNEAKDESSSTKKRPSNLRRGARKENSSSVALLESSDSSDEDFASSSRSKKLRPAATPSSRSGASNSSTPSSKGSSIIGNRVPVLQLKRIEDIQNQSLAPPSQKKNNKSSSPSSGSLRRSPRTEMSKSRSSTTRSRERSVSSSSNDHNTSKDSQSPSSSTRSSRRTKLSRKK